MTFKHSRQRIIIFDGPDGNGKTEMAKELSNSLNIPYFKNELEWSAFGNSPKNELFVNLLKFADPYFLSYLKQSGASVILDRAYPSEWVYSKEFCRTSNISALNASDKAYAELGALIIVPWRTKYDCGDKHNPVIDASRRSSLDALYNSFCSWTKCKTLRLNVDDENLDREMIEIMNFMNKLGCL